MDRGVEIVDELRADRLLCQHELQRRSRFAGIIIEDLEEGGKSLTRCGIQRMRAGSRGRGESLERGSRTLEKLADRTAAVVLAPFAEREGSARPVLDPVTPR